MTKKKHQWTQIFLVTIIVTCALGLISGLLYKPKYGDQIALPFADAETKYAQQIDYAAEPFNRKKAELEQNRDSCRQSSLCILIITFSLSGFAVMNIVARHLRKQS